MAQGYLLYGAKEAQTVAATGESGLPAAIASETNGGEEGLVAM